MSTGHPSFPSIPPIEISRKSLILSGVMVATQVAAFLIVTLFPEFSLPESQRVSDPMVGLEFAGMIVVYSLILVAAWRFYGRIPNVVRRALRAILSRVIDAWVAFVIILMAVTLVIGPWDVRAVSLSGLVVIYAAFKIQDTDFEWLLHNTVAFVLSVGAVALLGMMLDPWVAIVLMILLVVWDYVAVFLSELMADLVDFSASAGIPNYYVIPSGCRVELATVQEYVKDPTGDSPPRVAGVIGVGDFVFPSLLVISAATQVDHAIALAAALGTLGSVVALSAASSRAEGALPALPWLNTGAIAGFLVGYAVVVGL